MSDGRHRKSKPGIDATIALHPHSAFRLSSWSGLKQQASTEQQSSEDWTVAGVTKMLFLGQLDEHQIGFWNKFLNSRMLDEILLPCGHDRHRRPVSRRAGKRRYRPRSVAGEAQRASAPTAVIQRAGEACNVRGFGRIMSHARRNATT